MSLTGSSGPRSGFAVEKTRELLVLVTGLGNAVGLGVCEDDDAGGGLYYCRAIFEIFILGLLAIMHLYCPMLCNHM